METPPRPDSPLFVKRIEKFLDALASRPLLNIRPAAYSPQGLPYATINRRMLAATFDAVAITLLMAPFNGIIMRYTYGSLKPGSALEFNQALAQAGNSPEAMRTAFRLLQESGMLHAFFTLVIIQCAVLAAYCLVCWYFWAATPGKMLLHMRIVNAKTGARLSTVQALLRLAGYVVSGVPLMLGFFAISWSRQSRGWHDHIAGTSVVITRPFRLRLPFRLRRPAAGPSDSPAPSATE